jgi:hypothetical protein
MEEMTTERIEGTILNAPGLAGPWGAFAGVGIDPEPRNRDGFGLPEMGGIVVQVDCLGKIVYATLVEGGQRTYWLAGIGQVG